MAEQIAPQRADSSEPKEKTRHFGVAAENFRV
jgi:hypothetical protein